jgi:two-component system, cell cycle response regulator DivK
MPVVAVTAFAMTEDRLRVERDGFDAYIEKPLRIRALPGQVRRLLGLEAPDDQR